MTKSPTSTEFSVLVLTHFLLKIDIIRVAMLIYLYSDDGPVKFLQVLQLICACFCKSCNHSVLKNLPLNSSFLV